MLENTEKLNNQAIVLAQKGDYDEAIACFKRALIMEKQNYLLWYNLGLTYRDAGDLDKAKNAVQQAYYINSNDQEVIETLAVLCYSMGKIDESMGYCAIGLKLNDQNSHLWNTVGVLYFNQTDYPDAAEAFEQAITINPYYYDALFNLRDTYEELGNKAGYEECSARMKSIS
jgi:tetratricopeptide (TPR) repeat protein